MEAYSTKFEKRFVAKSGYIIKHIKGYGKLQFILEAGTPT
jgi:hypothetical protein